MNLNFCEFGVSEMLFEVFVDIIVVDYIGVVDYNNLYYIYMLLRFSNSLYYQLYSIVYYLIMLVNVNLWVLVVKFFCRVIVCVNVCVMYFVYNGVVVLNCDNNFFSLFIKWCGVKVEF